jgi:hypothetical protein
MPPDLGCFSSLAITVHERDQTRSALFSAQGSIRYMMRCALMTRGFHGSTPNDNQSAAVNVWIASLRSQ